MPLSAAPYLHGHHESVLRSHRWRTAENSAGYLLPFLDATAEVLDVGCGPGTITVGLGSYVTGGHVIGVDSSEGVLTGARREAEEHKRDNVRFEVGDVDDLGFSDGAFDVVHAHQVLQHVRDPVAALIEMRRVCRPGGIVAARDGDYGGMFWFPEDPDLEEWRSLYRRVATSVGGEPDAGRRLMRWARLAGLGEVTAASSSWCYSTSDERSWWGELWAERLLQSDFAHQATSSGLATRDDLEQLARAWRRWSASDDGWFVVAHGEILGRA